MHNREAVLPAIRFGISKTRLEKIAWEIKLVWELFLAALKFSNEIRMQFTLCACMFMQLKFITLKSSRVEPSRGESSWAEPNRNEPS